MMDRGCRPAAGLHRGGLEITGVGGHMDINYTGGIIASFIAVLLTDMVKIERWTDNAKLGLALAVSVAVAVALSAIDGRLGFNVGMGANIEAQPAVYGG